MNQVVVSDWWQMLQVVSNLAGLSFTGGWATPKALSGPQSDWCVIFTCWCIYHVTVNLYSDIFESFWVNVLKVKQDWATGADGLQVLQWLGLSLDTADKIQNVKIPIMVIMLQRACCRVEVMAERSYGIPWSCFIRLCVPSMLEYRASCDLLTVIADQSLQSTVSKDTLCPIGFATTCTDELRKLGCSRILRYFKFHSLEHWTMTHHFMGSKRTTDLWKGSTWID